jgi:hypothetical protein
MYVSQGVYRRLKLVERLCVSCHSDVPLRHICIYSICIYTIYVTLPYLVACCPGLAAPFFFGGWPEPYIHTPYITVYLVISLQNIPYTHRIYMVLSNPFYSRAMSHAPLSMRWYFDDPCLPIATHYLQGWPEPCIYAIYDRIFDEIPGKNAICTPYVYTWFWSF